MSLPDQIDLSKFRWSGPAGAKQAESERGAVKDEVTITGGRLDNTRTRQQIREDEEVRPYRAPKAKADLAKAEQDVKTGEEKRVDEPRKEFMNHIYYRRYAITIPALATALHTGHDPSGDLALTYEAAKLFDPDSAVRDQEQQALGNTSNFLEKSVQRIKKEFGLPEGGTFSPEARHRLRTELVRKAKALNNGYNQIRQQYQKLAKDRGLNPEHIIGPHLGTPHMEALRLWDGDQDGKPGVASRDGQQDGQPNNQADGTTRVGLLDAPPEGMQLAGEPIRAPRLSPESEEIVTQYAQSPGRTPEGYAKLVTERALADGIIKPEQVEETINRTLPVAQTYFEKLGKGKPGPGIDYSELDRLATANAPLGQQLLQAAKNAPGSAVQMAEGLVRLPVDALASAFTGERYGSFRAATDLVAGGADLLTGGDGNEMTNAFGDMLEDRYGSGDAIQHTAVTDPIGLLGDASLLMTGGGSAAARVPGAIGRAGQAVAASGRAIDPLNLMVRGAEQAPQAMRVAAGHPALRNAGNAATEAVGFPSGVGGSAIREAGGAGRERGRTGAPTPRSEAFARNMRVDEADGLDIVAKAQEAVGNLRTQASQRYTQKMDELRQNGQPVPLVDFEKVRESIWKMRPAHFDRMLDSKNRPTTHKAWEQMWDEVEKYTVDAVQNPDLLNPLELDQFKRDLREVGSNIGGQYDRQAGRFADTAYHGVRNAIISQNPLYGEAMGDYAKAMDSLEQLETAFGLRTPRGKQVNHRRVLNNLESIFRNNANTNYNQRAAQGQRLQDLDPSGTILPGTAGQMFSSGRARSLQSAALTGGIAAGGSALINPWLAPVGAMAFPRIAGEVAYGAGRAYGTAERALDTALNSSVRVGKDGKYELSVGGIGDLIKKYPTASLAWSQAGSRLEDTNEQELFERYNLAPAPAYPSLDNIAQGYRR